MTHIELRPSDHSGCPESAGALDRTRQWAVAAAAVTDPEASRGLLEVEGEFACGPVEIVGDQSEEEGGRRAEYAQPEPFGVARTGVVTELVDQRIVPASDVERQECGRVIVGGW